MNTVCNAPNFQVEVASDYILHALSENTMKAYSNDLAHFLSWGGVVPAPPAVVADYIAAHGTQHAVATLKRRLVSIRKAHTMQGYPDPVKSDIVNLTLKGISRLHGKPQRQVTPVMKDDLTLMFATFPTSKKRLRDQALLLIGFSAALRRSEIVSIKCEDLSFTAQGLILTIPRSKTDQSAVGVKIAIPFGRGRICPVRALKAWLEVGQIETGFVFRAVSKGGALSSKSLSSRAVANMVKENVSQLGLDKATYSGHSLRAGLCSSAAQNGASSWKIRQQSRHKSDQQLFRYIRLGDLFTDNAAALF